MCFAVSHICREQHSSNPGIISYPPSTEFIKSWYMYPMLRSNWYLEQLTAFLFCWHLCLADVESLAYLLFWEVRVGWASYLLCLFLEGYFTYLPLPVWPCMQWDLITWHAHEIFTFFCIFLQNETSSPLLQITCLERHIKDTREDSTKVNAMILPFIFSLITSCKPIIVVSVTILACVGKFSFVSLFP